MPIVHPLSEPSPAPTLNWEEEWRPGGIFDLMPDAIVAVRGDGRIANVNSQLSVMFGYDKNELIGAPIEILLPQRVRAHHERHRVGYQASPQVRAMSKQQNLLGLRRNGSEFPVDIMLSPVSSLADQCVIAVIRDVTAAKEAGEKLERLAYNDQLTGLPNRAALYRDLTERLAPDGSAEQLDVAVALFDLDGFKDVNDTLGHSIGDRLLQEVARRWTSVLEAPVRLYRLGGDEFVAVFPGSGDPLFVADVARAMIDRLAKPFDIFGNAITMGTSAGVATGLEAGADIDELLASADLALYRAKAEGRGSYALFVPTMRAEAQARRALLTEIEHAHAAGEFELYFQPQVSLPDGALSGAEALLRWQHPTRGTLLPKFFIDTLSASPLARDTGLWVLRQACRQARMWREAGHAGTSIAVNLFHGQLRDDALLRHVEDAISDFDIPPDRLELEISENFAFGGDAAVAGSLSALRRQGVRLALDDLGTGHASLTYLTRLPVSDVKIDQCFVRSMESDDRNAVMVQSLIAMAHGLGLNVVAEGVETARQADILAASHCDRAQGYYFGRPMPAAEFEAFAEERRAPAARRAQSVQ